jgi:hypothetical protein
VLWLEPRLSRRPQGGRTSAFSGRGPGRSPARLLAPPQLWSRPGRSRPSSPAQIPISIIAARVLERPCIRRLDISTAILFALTPHSFTERPVGSEAVSGTSAPLQGFLPLLLFCWRTRNDWPTRFVSPQLVRNTVPGPQFRTFNCTQWFAANGRLRFHLHWRLVEGFWSILRECAC